jgi:hypothetical protein
MAELERRIRGESQLTTAVVVEDNGLHEDDLVGEEEF